MKRLLQKHSVPSSRDPKTNYIVAEYKCLDEMGSMYFESTCTCPGFKFNGHCKHLAVLGNACDEQAEERRFITAQEI